MLEDLSYINCRDLLESTSIKNISESSGEISFSCPSSDHFHGDNSPSARMNSRTSAFFCHSCGKRGNGITFLAWHKSIPQTIARRLLEERYGGAISAGVGSLEKEVKRIMNPEIIEEEKRIPPVNSWLEAFHVDWKEFPEVQDIPHDAYWYIVDRGFNQKTLENWQIGYDQISDRITIPIRDHEGKLVGFKGRAWRNNTIPRYMILGDSRNHTRYEFQPYQKSRYVFGLDKIKDREDLVIVEGELNVIAMGEHGFRSAVGVAGSEFSDRQCELIRRYGWKAIVFLDNDKAGEKGTRKVIDMLYPYMNLKIVQNAPGDAADLDTKTVKELIDNAQPYLALQVEGKL